jgi:hypothetical protein
MGIGGAIYNNGTVGIDVNHDTFANNTASTSDPDVFGPEKGHGKGKGDKGGKGNGKH